MQNFYLIYQNIWNSCASGTGKGDPDWIRDKLLQVQAESRDPDIFNEKRLDPEDDEKLSSIIRDLDVIVDHLEYCENEIRTLAVKYKTKGDGGNARTGH